MTAQDLMSLAERCEAATGAARELDADILAAFLALCAASLRARASNAGGRG